MRPILALAVILLLVAPGAIADDLAVDVLRAKQARERAEARTIPVGVTKVYYVEDLVSLFKGGPKRASERVAELVGRNVPALRGGSVSAFPTNLSLVVTATDDAHRELAEYISKLSNAKKLLQESGFEILETN